MCPVVYLHGRSVGRRVLASELSREPCRASLRPFTDASRLVGVYESPLVLRCFPLA